MNIRIRTWKMDDATNLSLALNNQKIHDNLRDGFPFPYTPSDAASEWSFKIANISGAF